MEKSRRTSGANSTFLAWVARLKCGGSNDKYLLAVAGTVGTTWAIACVRDEKVSCVWTWKRDEVWHMRHWVGG